MHGMCVQPHCTNLNLVVPAWPLILCFRTSLLMEDNPHQLVYTCTAVSTGASLASVYTCTSVFTEQRPDASLASADDISCDKNWVSHALTYIAVFTELFRQEKYLISMDTQLCIYCFCIERAWHSSVRHTIICLSINQ